MLQENGKAWARITAGLVLLAALIGTFFRFYALDFQSLWLDEIAAVGPALFAESFSDAYWHHINLHPTPPLYSLFLMAWASLTGFSETLLRLPSAIIGLATVFVFYIGLRRVFAQNIAAVGTILMALSWPAIYYSQEIRAYSAVLLFTTWAAVVWIRLLHALSPSAPGKTADWVELFIASAFAALTHPFGFIITEFQWLYLLLVVRKSRALALRSTLFGFALLLAYLCWFIPNTIGIAKLMAGEQIYFERPGLWFFVHIGAFLYHHPVVAILTCVIPLAIGSVSYLRRFFDTLLSGNLYSPAVYLPFIILVPFLFAFLVAQIKPFMYSRHLIVFLPFIFVFIAYVLACARWRNPWLQPLLVFILAVIACYWIFRDFYEPDKPQNRELAAFALTEMDARTLLVVPCDPEPRFECRLGPGRATNPRWSKYLYYLNYKTLPELPTIPRTFRDDKELALILDETRARGTSRVVLIGSRGNIGSVMGGLRLLESINYRCEKRRFHRALGAICSQISG